MVSNKTIAWWRPNSWPLTTPGSLLIRERGSIPRRGWLWRERRGGARHPLHAQDQEGGTARQVIAKGQEGLVLGQPFCLFNAMVCRQRRVCFLSPLALPSNHRPGRADSFTWSSCPPPPPHHPNCGLAQGRGSPRLPPGLSLRKPSANLSRGPEDAVCPFFPADPPLLSPPRTPRGLLFPVTQGEGLWLPLLSLSLSFLSSAGCAREDTVAETLGSNSTF